MFAIASFWLLLCVPGYALLRRFRPQALESGFLGAVGLGYIATFALLTPVSVVGYLFHLPLWVLSVAVIGMVSGGVALLLFDLVRNRPRLRFDPIAIIVLAVIAADMIIGARVGAYLVGDGNFHIARVRMLMTYGFNSWDPVVASRRLDTVYHSNLYHALIAVSGQLTRQYAARAWAPVWFWAKLMSAAGIYQLAYSVLRRRELASIAAVTFAVFMASYSVLAYPNTLVVYGFLTYALAFLIEAVTGKCSYFTAIGIAACSAILVQWHALYHVFACVLLAPVLLFAIVRATWKRLPGKRELVCALLALSVGAPWFVVRAWPAIDARIKARHVAAVKPAEPEPTSDYPEPGWSYTDFIRRGHGRLMLDPSPLYDPRSQQGLMIAMLALGLLTRRQRNFLVIAGSVASAAIVLYVPAVCTAFAHVAGGAWVVRRLSTVFNAIQLALFPGAIVLVLAERIEQLRAGARVLATALPALALLASVTYAYRFGVNYNSWTRAGYLDRDTPGHTQKQLGRRERAHKFLSEHIESEAVVAITPRLFPRVFSDCNCYPMALPEGRGSHGLPDMDARRKALDRILAMNEPVGVRVELMKRYGVRYLLVPTQYRSQYHRGYRRVLVNQNADSQTVVIAIDPDRLGRR